MYNAIRFKHKEIDGSLTSIYKDYNDLSLVHESKLGHSLKDMEQFLLFYKSTDEGVQALLSKLNMIISVQRRQMEIEIFGENPLNCEAIKQQLLAIQQPNLTTQSSTAQQAKRLNSVQDQMKETEDLLSEEK